MQLETILAQGLDRLSGARMVRQHVFVEEQGYQLEFDEIDAAAWHILLMDGDRPVATGRTFPDETGCWHIGRVAVEKEYRGQAIGKLVVAGLEEQIRQLGGRRAVLSAQLHARRFYESMGYTAFGDTVYDEGQPHITMEKQL